jgi:biotin-(acetyl-CoA carboxylase) ligase
VIGIGLNVNQTKFSQFDRKATSLKLVLNKAYDILEVQHKLLHFLEKRVVEFKAKIKQDEDYLQALYLFEKWTTFEVNNTQFSGRIKGVNSHGNLLIEKEDGNVNQYDLQEVEFLF